MWKFQGNYNIQIENMEDLILISYVMIDELYKQYTPQKVTKRKNVSKVKLSVFRPVLLQQVQQKTQRSSSGNGTDTGKIVSTLSSLWLVSNILFFD